MFVFVVRLIVCLFVCFVQMFGSEQTERQGLSGGDVGGGSGGGGGGDDPTPPPPLMSHICWKFVSGFTS